MAWRLYYTLEEAAEKLGREFNDTYTANDLIHYASIGLVELYINGIGRSYSFVKRPFYDLMYDEEEKGKYAELPEALIHGGDFIPITEFDAMVFQGGAEYIEKKHVEKLAAMDINGELIKIYAESSSEWKDLETLTYCLIPNELVGKLFISSEDEPTKREEIDKPGNVIRVKRQDLCILQDDLTILHQELVYRIKGKKAKEVNDKKSLLNIISALKDALIDKGVYKNQAGIIEYLANEAEGYGLSEANLKAKFAEANKLKKSN